MRTASRSATATLLVAAAGALLGAALISSPVANADDSLTLPVPPFNPDQYFYLPGTAGAITNDVDGA